MLFLKRIEINGFKSFSTKTVVNFYDGLTALIGPNGSGKSNIIDAIKWVLGEQSIKSLRGKSGEDNIFSGSETLQQLDMAEVNLVFDNSNHQLNHPASEVQITRKIYRGENQNEYFINNQKVRLKDVKDVILNTGLGNTNLTIISQGTIQKLAESKPEERRLILNEAAGVAKYRLNKLESLKDLEKINNDLNLVKVKIDELEKQIKPLAKQAEKAKIYLEKKVQLQDIELGILSKEVKKQLDVFKTNEEKLKIKQLDLNILLNQINNLETQNNSAEEKIIEYEKEITTLNQEQNKLQNKINLLHQRNEKISTSNEQDIILKINELTNQLDFVKSNIENGKHDQEEMIKQVNKVIDEKQNYSSQVEKLQYQINNFQNEITNLKISNLSKTTLGYGTKKILENKNLFSNIAGIFSDLVEIESKYQFIISNFLNRWMSVIIVESAEDTIKPIKFLKENNYGMAFFMPLDKIKERNLNDEQKIIFKSLKGFEGIGSQFVKGPKEIKRLINFLLTNVLIFDSITNAIEANKILENRYPIICLDFSQINTNNSISGGSFSKQKQHFNINEQIKSKEELIEKLRIDLKIKQDSLFKFDTYLQEGINKRTILSSRLAIEDERKNNLETNLISWKNEYTKLTGTIFESKIKTITTKDDLLSSINNQQKNADKLQIIQNSKIDLIEKTHKNNQILQNYHKQQTNLFSEINELNAIIATAKSKINSYVTILNLDYQITLDHFLTQEHILKIPFEKGKELVKKLRFEISELGNINIDAINQFSENNKRYQQLIESNQDLIDAEVNLAKTIKQLDQQMIEQFDEIFQKLRVAFKHVFKHVFNGGNADLIYVDEEDILESGIEVIANPPGKKINNLSLYSGGEKAMIAIALILAIFEVRNVPILILDEAEAALDESNVDKFAKYCKELNNKTQVLIVTHRPGTMEQCSYLYGVTMQEKGVTKIITVQLEKAIQMVGD